jgi:hypothetical protein
VAAPPLLGLSLVSMWGVRKLAGMDKRVNKKLPASRIR